MKVHQFSRPAALAAMALAAAFFGGCVSQTDYNASEAARKQALEQLGAADNELSALRAKVDSLSADLAAKNEIIRNGLGSDALLKDRDLLASRLAELQKKYDELVALAGKPDLPSNVRDALRELADKYPGLEWDEKNGLLRIKSDVTFALGSTEVQPQAKAALRELAQILDMKEIAGNELRIVGHTDDVPITARAGSLNPTNWILSTNRANSVRDELQKDGVSETRMQAAGWGEYRPIEANAPGKKGSARNRRVEIYILPSKVPDNLVISSPGVGVPAPRPRTIGPGPAASAPAPRTPATPDSGFPMPRPIGG